MKFLSRVEQFEKIKIHYRPSKKKMLCFGIIDSQYSSVWLKLKCIKISGGVYSKRKDRHFISRSRGEGETQALNEYTVLWNTWEAYKLIWLVEAHKDIQMDCLQE